MLVYGNVNVEDTMFVGNEAATSGQALYIDKNARKIRNITIVSKSKNNADHLYALGNKGMFVSLQR